MTLKEARKLRGMSQVNLSSVSGVSVSQIQKIESGNIDIGNITSRNFLSLTRALEIDPYELVGVYNG